MGRLGHQARARDDLICLSAHADLYREAPKRLPRGVGCARLAPGTEGCLIEYEQLRPFATERQGEYLDALARAGSQRKAAELLGVDRRGMQRSLECLRKKAARAGYSPPHDLTHPVAPGQILRGASTLYDADGNLVQQWIKSAADREAMEAIAREIVEAMSSDIKREKPAPKPRVRSDADLLNLYVISDAHVGMYSWGEETGADWDIETAENMIVSWLQKAISTAPDAKTGLLALLGDLVHFDSMEAVTPEHRNILDADTRFEKIVRVVIRSVRRVVRMLLEKHDSLHIVVAAGNHDPSSSVWIREWLSVLYENEPRVTVDVSPSVYHAYEHGSTLLGFHHGDRRKLKAVDEVIAAQFREEYGRTKHCYIHIGHKHEQAQYESNLALVEQHRTLAAPDAYSARGGWKSGRSASVITYSKEFGEVGRIVISPELALAGA